MPSTPVERAMPYVHQRTGEPANQPSRPSSQSGQGAEDHAGRTCLLRRDSLSPDISLADTPNFCRRFCSAFLSRQATADHMSTETEIPIEYPALAALPRAPRSCTRRSFASSALQSLIVAPANLLAIKNENKIGFNSGYPRMLRGRSLQKFTRRNVLM